jgi:hypothetical protein
MDHKRAAILLYGLQIASTNLRAKPAAPPPDPPDSSLHESVISTEALNPPKDAAEKPAPSLSKAPSHFTPAQPQPATDNLQPPTCNHQPPNKNRLPRCQRNRKTRRFTREASRTARSAREPSRVPSPTPPHSTPYNRLNDFAYSGLPASNVPLPG